MGKDTTRLLSDGVYHVYNRDLGRTMILSTNDEKNSLCRSDPQNAGILSPEHLPFQLQQGVLCLSTRRSCGPLW